MISWTWLTYCQLGFITLQLRYPFTFFDETPFVCIATKDECATTARTQSTHHRRKRFAYTKDINFDQANRDEATVVNGTRLEDEFVRTHLCRDKLFESRIKTVRWTTVSRIHRPGLYSIRLRSVPGAYDPIPFGRRRRRFDCQTPLQGWPTTVQKSVHCWGKPGSRSRTSFGRNTVKDLLRPQSRCGRDAFVVHNFGQSLTCLPALTHSAQRSPSVDARHLSE